VKLQLCIVVMLVALAGCSGRAPEPVTPAALPSPTVPETAATGAAASAAAPTPASSPPPQPGGGNEGGAAPAPSSAHPTEAANGSSALAPLVLAVASKGTVPAAADACVHAYGQGACEGVGSLLATPMSSDVDVPVTGRVTGGDLTLAYDATGGQALAVSALVVGPSTTRLVAAKEGLSPVALALPAFDVGPDEILRLSVGAVMPDLLPSPGPAFARASPADVAFSLEGAVRALAQPTATRILSYKLEGIVPASARGCAFSAGCASFPNATAWTEDQPKVGARPLSGSLVMAWDVQSPTTGTMAFDVAVVNSTRVFTIGHAEGESPLKLDVPKVILPAGMTLVVRAYVPPQPSPVPASLAASPLDQPFTIQGSWSVAG
jgi:hypothetical protein